MKLSFMWFQWPHMDHKNELKYRHEYTQRKVGQSKHQTMKIKHGKGIKYKIGRKPAGLRCQWCTWGDEPEAAFVRREWADV